MVDDNETYSQNGRVKPVSVRDIPLSINAKYEKLPDSSSWPNSPTPTAIFMVSTSSYLSNQDQEESDASRNFNARPNDITANQIIATFD